MADQDPLAAFVALSSALTGVAGDQLRPAVDPIGIAAQYLAAVREKNAAELDAALATFAREVAKGKPPAAAAPATLADPAAGPVCRGVITLWLLGTWSDPGLAEAGTFDPKARVVSSQAYKEGLVWKVMQSHPMGYSMFEFGYWAEPPPPLGEFITLAPEGATNG
jgi:hypothetical protein